MENKPEKLFTGNEAKRELINTATWKRGLEFAKEKHEGQLRDEGTPYFEHIKGTMKILINEAKTRDDEILTVAALHDVLEDTDCTYEELEAEFGSRIANCVELLTKDSKNGQTFADYSRRIFESKEFQGAGMVKLADRLHNLRSLPKTNNPEKIQRKIIETENCILIYENQSSKILMRKVKEQLTILKSLYSPKKNNRFEAYGSER